MSPTLDPDMSGCYFTAMQKLTVNSLYGQYLQGNRTPTSRKTVTLPTSIMKKVETQSEDMNFSAKLLDLIIKGLILDEMTKDAGSITDGGIATLED
jgi:hypothetical protein